MCEWFSNFFEKAFVRRVKRRIDIRIVRFARSTYDVLMCAGSGSPMMTFGLQPMHPGGEYLPHPSFA